MKWARTPRSVGDDEKMSPFSRRRMISRAFTTFNRQNYRDPESKFDCSDSQTRNPVELKLLGRLQQHGSSSPETPHILNQIVSLCTKSNSLNLGIQIQSTIIKMGFCSNVHISSALVDLYGKCGAISCARKVFDEMPNRNAVTWNSLISGHLAIGCPELAVGLFLEMVNVGIAPTVFSVSAVLAGCSQLEDGELGAQVHGLSLKAGFCDNVVVGTALVDMYAKDWSVEDARGVFDEMMNKNVIMWTSMIAGYSQSEKPDEAMSLFRKMHGLGLRSNSVTYNSLLSSFSASDYLDYCVQVHCRIIREGLESNAYIAVTLVTVYSRCSNSLEDFQKVCSCVSKWDLISWNAVIGGFSNLGYGMDALECFSDMRREGINADFFTLTTLLGAIGITSSTENGRQMHAVIIKTGYASHIHVQNGLVSMYARCGDINDSKRVFSAMDNHDVISWNSVLSGCAHHGHGREAVELFEEMRRTNVKPDSTTFLTMLCACSHVGMLEKGLEYFDLMKNDAMLEPPRAEHYTSVVDLFGRAGCLVEAEAFINSMPIEPGPSVYKALLSSSQVHGNKEIAARSAKKLLELYPNDPATYVLLSNMLRTEGFWDDAAGVRNLMCNKTVRKKPGYSWI